MFFSLRLLQVTFLRVTCALIVLVLCAAVAGADWPQFQGPNRDGISPGGALARSWPADGPATLWSFPLGEGFAGPAIRDGEVYLLDRVGTERDVLRCFDLESGRQLWNYSYDAPGSVSYDGSRTTPTVTAEHVFTVGMTGRFYCIDRTTHRPVWNIDLPERFPVRGAFRWGYSQSPSIYKDLVIIAPQSPQGFVAAFNKTSGELVWASGNIGNLGYSTPVVANLAGVDQVVMINTGKNSVNGLSVEDGTTLWSYGGWHCRIPIPFATPLPGDRLFITGEYGAGSAMIQIVRDGSGYRVEELFKTHEVGSQIHQPLVYGNHLYANSNGNERADGMVCMDFDGTLKWRTRDTRGLPKFERGGLLLAGDLIVNFDGRRGTLHLIEPNPEGYTELAQARIFKGQKMWSPMALSGGKLVMRSQDELKCLDLGMR